MKNTQNKFLCRVCNSDKSLFDLTSVLPKRFSQFFLFSYRGNNSSSIFCKKCGSLSFYNEKDTNYKTGEYRNKNNQKLPVDLPWATITYKRHEAIFNFINSSLSMKKKSDFEILDFGGYNGFCAYGICSKFGIPLANAYIADLDPNGLSIASSLGLSIYDLGVLSLKKYLHKRKKLFDLIIAVQVLEHLQNPSNFFSEIKNHINSDGIIYIEVPSRFFFPLSDKSHLTTFSKEAIINLAESHGFKVLKNKTSSTPKESILYGYPFSSEFENQVYIFQLAKNNKKNSKDKIKENRHSLKKFIFLAFTSDIFLRLIVTKNYFKLLNKNVKLFIKSTLILFLIPIFLILNIINIFLKKGK